MKPLFSTYKKVKIAGHSWQGFLLKNNVYAVLASDFSKFLGAKSKDDRFIGKLLSDISKHGEISTELLRIIDNPILVEIDKGNSKSVYTVDVLPAVCAEIISAKESGYLLSSQMPIAKQAQKLFDDLSFELFAEEIDRNSGFLDLKLKVKNVLTKFMFRQEPRDEIYWTEVLNDHFFENVLKTIGLDWKTAIGNEEKLANFIYDATFIRVPNDLFATLKANKPKRIYVPKTGALKIQNPQLQEFANSISNVISECNYDAFAIDNLLHVRFPKFYNREELAFLKQNASPNISVTHFDDTISKAFVGRPSEFMKE